LTKGLLLDRDGTIIELFEHLHRPQDVSLLPGAARVIGLANEQGLPVGVVTNQSGIARHLFGWAEFDYVSDEIERQLWAEGSWLDGVSACPFHPGFTPDWGSEHAHWRKPGGGMLELVGSALEMDLAASWMMGDNITDIAAARAARMAGAVHVATGHGEGYRREALAQANEDFAVELAADIGEAGEILARRGFFVSDAAQTIGANDGR